MSLFAPPSSRRFGRAQARIWALFEIAYTLVDFTAATLFIVGSILFFDEATTRTGTWLFLIGSVFFALKPTLRLAREIWLAGHGDTDALARRGESDIGTDEPPFRTSAD
jgi:hypothetical protein